MRKLLQKIFKKPITWLANRYSSSPIRKNVFSSLSQLFENITVNKKSGPLFSFEMDTAKFIIFSDQHKGAKDMADDFRNAEPNYLTALEYYYKNDFVFVSLGDSEELWENTPKSVVEKNRISLLEEAKFLLANRYYKVYGNHDLEWKYTIQQNMYLKPIFGDKLSICEGIVMQTIYNNKTYSIFLTHGHQGDQKSDGNAFSTWVVAAVWTPIQRFFEISIDTISDSFELVDKHNILMYEWSATQNDMIFISGHTHKPVFASLDHIERLAKQLELARDMNDQIKIEFLQKELEKRKEEYAGKKFVRSMAKPTYFNSGCCCFNDGDITGIEIAEGFIRLIKWETVEKESKRKVLEESPLFYLFDQLETQIK
jgi:predicted phosphodiesterase